MILVGILINIGNVIGRYVFLEPIIWAEEIMIYIMVWTVFIGAILVSYEGQHLKMDVFSVMLPTPYKEIINFIATASVLLVCVYVIPNNWVVVELMFNNDQRSVGAEVPRVIPHFAR
jgi:C4-dicarboxylate transporter DctQ subunit